MARRCLNVNSNAWKKAEARNAKEYDPCHGQRVSLSGGNNRQAGTRADNILPCLPHLFVELKHGRRFSALARLWAKYRGLAVAEGKVPVIVIHPLGGKSRGSEPLALISRDRHAALERVARMTAEMMLSKPMSLPRTARLAEELQALGLVTLEPPTPRVVEPDSETI